MTLYGCTMLMTVIDIFMAVVCKQEIIALVTIWYTRYIQRGIVKLIDKDKLPNVYSLVRVLFIF